MFNKSNIDNIKDKTQEAVHDASGRVETAVNKLTERGSEMLNDGTRKTQALAQEVSGRVESAVHKLTDRGSEMIHDGTRKAQALADLAVEKSTEYKDQCEDYVSKKPLQSVAIAAAAGAVLAGLAMLITRKNKD